MSKFLKIIVNLVVLISIVIAAALLVPPFVGVDTVMNDNTDVDTNLPVGYVAYGKPVKTSELKKGDKIIQKDGASAYIYEITDMDASAGAYRVKDVYNKKSDDSSVTLKKTASKAVVVVPFIGYAAIALQSKEGLIVVGLGIVFLIILFILSELFRKDDDDDEDDEEYEDDDDEEEDDEEEEELSRKERKRLKKEEKRRRKEEKRRRKEEEYEDDDDEEEDDEEEEEELSRKERRRLKKEEKRRRKLEKKGLLEDDEEEEEEVISKTSPAPSGSSDPQGFEDAMKEAMSSIAMGVANVSEPETVPDATIMMPDSKELEKAVESAVGQTEETAVQEPDAEEETADAFRSEEESINIEETETIPFDPETVLQTPTVKELLEKAEVAGENPEVKEDKDNEITLLDYSDIL